MNKHEEESGSTKDGSSSKHIDVNSIYYIHAFGYPKQMHVNDLLNDNNYSDWKEEMQNFLFAKNKISFVHGTLEMTKEGMSDLMM